MLTTTRESVVLRWHSLQPLLPCPSGDHFFSSGKDKLEKIATEGCFISKYQTEAIIPFLRWLRRVGGVAARPPQAPANRAPLDAQNDGNDKPPVYTDKYLQWPASTTTRTGSSSTTAKSLIYPLSAF